MTLELPSENMNSLNNYVGNATLTVTSSTALPTRVILVTTSVEFYPWGLLLFIICVFGMIGNGLSVIVLVRPKMKSTYSTLTLGLTFCDTIQFLNRFLRFSLQSMFLHYEVAKSYTDILMPIIGPESRAVGFIALTAGTYMTLAVSIDRYLAVCWPFQARKFCTRGKAYWTILMVIIFSTVYNLPRFWEFGTEVNYTIPNGNDNKSVITYYKMTQLPFRNNPAYNKYYTFWAFFLVMFLIPFVSLYVFNFLIWRAIQLSAAKREKLTSRQNDENSFAVMLWSVVVVFLICNCVFPILDIIAFAGYKYNAVYNKIGHVMLTLNSAVNFLLYCIFGKRFRREFLAFLHEIAGRLALSDKEGDHSLTGGTRISTTGGKKVPNTDSIAV